MDIDERFTDILTKYRLQIVQQLQMDRTFLFDYLISKSSFDKTDFELIKAETTSEQKAGRFLDILETKGESAFDHFIDALQIINPSLFEILTGKKPGNDLTTNPIWTDVKSHIFCGGGSSFLDLDILTNYSKRLTVDLQEVTLRYDQVLKDNRELRKKLQEALQEQGRHQRRIDALQQQVLDTEDALVSEAHSNAGKVGANLLERVEIVDREGKMSQFIIQLQMKLLKAHEENETFRRQLAEFRDQNDGLLKQLSKVNENYAFERKETIKLSQQLMSQSEEVKGCEAMKFKIRELQFQTGKLRAELQEKQDDLTEVKRWTEALKARYDLVVDERENMLKSQETMEADCGQTLDEVRDLKLKLGYKEREIEELKRTNREIEGSLKMYREERDFCCNAMKEAALELEQARQERQEDAQRYNKALEAKEASLNHKMEYERQLELKYEETKAELTSVKSLLNQEKADKEELRETVSKLETKIQHIKESIPKPYMEDLDHEEQQTDDVDNVSQTQDPHEPASATGHQDCFMDWKERTAKDLVISIKGRVLPPNQQQTKEKRKQAIRKSRSYDEQLSKLVPEFEELPSDLQKSCSLDQHRMKQILPFEALATLCPGIRGVGHSLHDVLGTVTSHSCENSPVMRRAGRNMSTPTGEYFSERGLETTQEKDACAERLTQRRKLKC